MDYEISFGLSESSTVVHFPATSITHARIDLRPGWWPWFIFITHDDSHRDPTQAGG